MILFSIKYTLYSRKEITIAYNKVISDTLSVVHPYSLLKVLERAFISLVCAIQKLNVYNDRNRIGTFFVARGNYEVIEIIVKWSRDEFFRRNTFTFYFFSRVESLRYVALHLKVLWLILLPSHSWVLEVCRVIILRALSLEPNLVYPCEMTNDAPSNVSSSSQHRSIVAVCTKCEDTSPSFLYSLFQSLPIRW